MSSDEHVKPTKLEFLLPETRSKMLAWLEANRFNMKRVWIDPASNHMNLELLPEEETYNYALWHRYHELRYFEMQGDVPSPSSGILMRFKTVKYGALMWTYLTETNFPDDHLILSSQRVISNDGSISSQIKIEGSITEVTKKHITAAIYKLQNDENYALDHNLAKLLK